MKRRNQRIIFTGLLALMWMTLTSEKCNDDTACKETVVAMDMTSLDGCGILLITEDGKKLLPTNLDDFAPDVKPGDGLLIDYKTEADAMSICMAENAMITLTCLARLPMTKNTASCKPMVDPGKQEWSMEALKAVDPYQIDHLVTANLEYYKFIGKKDCRLYDCMGKLICSGTCNEKDECEMYFASNSITIESSQIIYVKDN